jgi:hypothetical protein
MEHPLPTEGTAPRIGNELTYGLVSKPHEALQLAFIFAAVAKGAAFQANEEDSRTRGRQSDFYKHSDDSEVVSLSANRSLDDAARESLKGWTLVATKRGGSRRRSGRPRSPRGAGFIEVLRVRENPLLGQSWSRRTRPGRKGPA